MKIDMGEEMTLTEVVWNKDSKGSHRLVFTGTEPNPTEITFNTSTSALRILRKPFEVADLWVLKVHFGEMPTPNGLDMIPAQWIQIGIFSSWKAAKARLDQMVNRGDNIVNDSQGKAWDIKRWDLEN